MTYAIQPEGRMTVDEVALLREIVRWRRGRKAEYEHAWGSLRMPDGRSITWNTYSALHWPRTGEIGVCADRRRRPLSWHEVHSVTEAVDVIVALGYLPPRFSSAYRAGWEASRVWHDPDECHVPTPEFKRMFHDPDNIAFPAVESAW